MRLISLRRSVRRPAPSSVLLRFIFGVVIREAFWLAKATLERASRMTLPQDTLRGCGCLLEISDAEIFNRCAQEYAVPSFKRTEMLFERHECLLQIVNGTATPKRPIESRMRFFLFARTGLDVVGAVGRHGLGTQHLMEGLESAATS